MSRSALDGASRTELTLPAGTCHTAGETLKDEVEERTASALAAATRNGKAR